MKKPIFFAVSAVFVVLVGGFFYWWQNQADVRELNKTLPDGVRVVKSLVGDEYKVVNKIDGYEFKIPPEWQGIKGAEYISKREQDGFMGTSINIDGLEGNGKTIAIDLFQVDDILDIRQWAENMFNVFGLVGEFSYEQVGNIGAIKTKEDVHLWGDYVYFFKNSKGIYVITASSEELIRYVITNGKW